MIRRILLPVAALAPVVACTSTPAPTGTTHATATQAAIAEGPLTYANLLSIIEERVGEAMRVKDVEGAPAELTLRERVQKEIDTRAGTTPTHFRWLSTANDYAIERTLEGQAFEGETQTTTWNEADAAITISFDYAEQLTETDRRDIGYINLTHIWDTKADLELARGNLTEAAETYIAALVKYDSTHEGVRRYVGGEVQHMGAFIDSNFVKGEENLEGSVRSLVTNLFDQHDAENVEHVAYIFDNLAQSSQRFTGTVYNIVDDIVQQIVTDKKAEAARD